MEGISITEWINVLLGAFAVLGGIVYSLVRNHVLLAEAQKKIEVLFELVNSLRDRINNGKDK
tara:strand:- start:118 stop:303 length:186 start_codon:yes stop_codon:yes gene_type:complete